MSIVEEYFRTEQQPAKGAVQTTCTDIAPDGPDLNDNVLTFTIPASPTLFTDPHIRLLLRVKLQQTEGKPPGRATWINLIPKTMFKTMTVSLNETTVMHVQDFPLHQFVLTRVLTSAQQKKTFASAEECESYLCRVYRAVVRFSGYRRSVRCNGGQHQHGLRRTIPAL